MGKKCKSGSKRGAGLAKWQKKQQQKKQSSAETAEPPQQVGNEDTELVEFFLYSSKLAIGWLLFFCLANSERKKLVWNAGQRAQVRVAIRVDSSSSSGIRDGLGVGAVAGSENEVGVSAEGGGDQRPRFCFWMGPLVGTAAPQSGWEADGPGMGLVLVLA
jgi:hypothetical protein